MTSLDGWENFYVIIGSSAAALTGLMFVVITLRAGRANLEDAATAFSSPIVSTPRQTAASLAICLGIAGVSGLVYTVRTVIRIRRQTVYTPVLEDWLWHAIFPLVAYAAVAGAALILWQRAGLMLYVIAASALLLLYTGIHNSWDAAMYLASRDNSGSSV
jgi:hypothetical protein